MGTPDRHRDHDEDQMEVPPSWLRSVHPRRGGQLVGWPYNISDELRDDLTKLMAARGPAIEQILDHPRSNADVVLLARHDASLQGDAVRYAAACGIGSVGEDVLLAEAHVARLGLPRAVRIGLLSIGYQLKHGGLASIGEPPFLEARSEVLDLLEDFTGPGTGGFDHLRRLLVRADDETYRRTIEEMEAFRSGLFGQRILTSYLLPERLDWVVEDFAAFPSTYAEWRYLLVRSAAAPQQLRGWWPYGHHDYVTIWDGLGEVAVQVFAQLLPSARWYPDMADKLLDVLTRIPTDEAFLALLEHADVPGLPEAIFATAQRFPRRALRLMVQHRHLALVGVLLDRVLASHPDWPGAAPLVPLRLPDAPAERVPALLASPPWKRHGTKQQTLVVPSAPPEMSWLPGEQQAWLTRRWEWAPPSDWQSLLGSDTYEQGRFYTDAPEELVRPRLADWNPLTARFFFERPQLLVAKYQIEALAPILRLAQGKPAVGAELLLPFRSAQVAFLMARWLVRSRRLRAVAQQWFRRHGARGVEYLLPAAFSGPEAERRLVAMALARLDSDDIAAAAAALGIKGPVQALMAADALNLLPPRMKRLPGWLAGLPQITLRGRAEALPPDAVEALCAMIAISALDAPYEGLQVIAEACDPQTLAAFVWNLHEQWILAGRPAKDVWAMDALAYFGDDTVADRFSPMVLQWPHEGSAARAKRGADILGAMNSDVALQRLGAIARSAHSAPLRVHAALALDHLALDRGLLPEQLDDLLTPELGLDGEGIQYRGVNYQVGLTSSWELTLCPAKGSPITVLPKPTNDVERATWSDWTRRRKLAKATIADQTARLQEAMIRQRRWTADEFASSVVAHPLLGRLARTLIWVADDQLSSVDSLGDLVDLNGALLGPFQWVQLAHPATSDLRTWRTQLSARAIRQPFLQIDRLVGHADPSAYWNRKVPTAALFGLIRRGWQWGPAGHASLRDVILRDFGARGTVAMRVEPGFSAVTGPNDGPEQQIVELALLSPTHGGLAVFADLPRVTRSELATDLESLS